MSVQSKLLKLLPKSVVDSKPVTQAIARYDAWQPAKDVDYTPVIDQCESAIKSRLDSNRRIEDKSLEIIKYMGGGAGLLTIGTVSQVNDRNWPVVLWALLPMSFAIGAVICASVARTAADYLAGTKPTWDARYRAKYDVNAMRISVLDLALATYEYAGSWKKRFYKYAQRLSLVAIVTLLVPVIVSGGLGCSGKLSVVPNPTATVLAK
ncbi:MAG: hypothetical protein U0796_15015 [Gemmatales bacterium]